MKRIWYIAEKELIDNLRDYRSWVTGVFWALFGPVLLGGLIVLLGNTIRDRVINGITLPVQGAEHAPNLVDFLKQHRVVVEPAPADPRAAVMAGDVNLVLIIPPEYGESFLAGETATLQIVFDSSRPTAALDVTLVRSLLEGYGEYIGTLRLLVRGVDPRVIRVIQIEDVDTSTPQSQALILISMLPYFIISAIFSGAAPVITDATAGERERGSLEPLLINPLPRGWFAVGKMLSAIPFSAFNLLTTLTGFWALFFFLPIEDVISIQIRLNLDTLAAIFLICLPIVLLACAIQTLIASFTRTTKEANTYLPFVGLIPALPGIALAFLPVKPDLWAMIIPTFGQQILINQFLRSEPILISNVVISAVLTLLLTLVITWVSIKLYENERIVMLS